MAPRPCAFEQRLDVSKERFRFEVTPCRGAQSFATLNTNGSQRGGRPIVQFLPYRVRDVELLEGADLRPVITDNFILVPHPGPSATHSLRVVFRAKRL